MKQLSTIFALLFFAVIGRAQSEEKPIQISGIVSVEIFPGPPNYESIKDGDQAERVFILSTKSEKKFERLQLVVLEDFEAKFKILNQNIGKKIEVQGSIWEANTGHHHTAFLITVKTLKTTEPNQSPEPMPMAVTPPAAQASRQPSKTFGKENTPPK